jgi:hypothetical protein
LLPIEASVSHRRDRAAHGDRDAAADGDIALVKLVR